MEIGEAFEHFGNSSFMDNMVDWNENTTTGNTWKAHLTTDWHALSRIERIATRQPIDRKLTRLYWIRQVNMHFRGRKSCTKKKAPHEPHHRLSMKEQSSRRKNQTQLHGKGGLLKFLEMIKPWCILKRKSTLLFHSRKSSL